jgi:outer membrane immunogenic protein
MKRILLSTVSSIVLAGAAAAADLPLKAPAPVAVTEPLWAGWYIGIQGGAARQHGRFTDFGSTFGSILFPEAPGPTTANDTGGTAGINLGINWQTGSFVYGLEGDWSWVDAKAGTSQASVLNNTVFATSFDTQWVGTVRARAGFAADTTLFYVTGGAAFGNVKDSAMLNLGNAPAGGLPPHALLVSETKDTTRIGWTAGLGVEHMFARNWTVRGEVRYVDFGSSTVTSTSPVPGMPTYRGEFSNNLVMGLVGVDFRF